MFKLNIRCNPACFVLLCTGFLIFFIPSKAFAERIIFDVLPRLVRVNLNFDGSEVMVFGSIERDINTATHRSYSIVVVVEGPPKNYRVWKKSNPFGIWIQGKANKLFYVPSAKFTLSNKALSSITSEKVLQDTKIGLKNLAVINPETVESDYYSSFLDHMLDKGLYYDKTDGVAFIGSHLFRAQIKIPSNAPVGQYKVRVLLFSSHFVIKEEKQVFHVHEVGVIGRLHNMTIKAKAFYAMIVILSAILVGWLGRLVFMGD